MSEPSQPQQPSSSAPAPVAPGGAEPITRRGRIAGIAAIAVVLGAGGLIWLTRPAQPATATGPTELDPIAVSPPAFNDEVLVRPDLREALGKVPNISPRQRIDLLDGIRGTLGKVECRMLLHELLQPRPPTVEEGWQSIYVQGICLILDTQESVRVDYARALATLVQDGTRDAVVRDYAVQHLRIVWERSADLPELRPSIEATFRSLVTGPEPAMAATGLLSLHLLGTRDGAGALPGQSRRLPAGLTARGQYETPVFAVPDSQVQPLVDAILKSPPNAGNLPCRMTALRIVNDRRLAASRPELRTIAAAKENEHALVRMGAIAALGRFADPEDRPLLESLDRTDDRIDAALKTALVNF